MFTERRSVNNQVLDAGVKQMMLGWKKAGYTCMPDYMAKYIALEIKDIIKQPGFFHVKLDEPSTDSNFVGDGAEYVGPGGNGTGLGPG